MKALTFITILLLCGCSDDSAEKNKELAKNLSEMIEINEGTEKELNETKEKLKDLYEFMKLKKVSMDGNSLSWPKPKDVLKDFKTAEFGTNPKSNNEFGTFQFLYPDKKHTISVFCSDDIITLTSYIPEVKGLDQLNKYHKVKHDIFSNVFGKVFKSWDGAYQSMLHILMLQEGTNKAPVIFFNQFYITDYERTVLKDGTRHEYIAIKKNQEFYDKLLNKK